MKSICNFDQVWKIIVYRLCCTEVSIKASYFGLKLIDWLRCQKQYMRYSMKNYKNGTVYVHGVSFWNKHHISVVIALTENLLHKFYDLYIQKIIWHNRILRTATWKNERNAMQWQSEDNEKEQQLWNHGLGFPSHS